MRSCTALISVSVFRRYEAPVQKSSRKQYGILYTLHITRFQSNKQSEKAPIWDNIQRSHISRPAHGVLPRKQHRKLPTDGAVHGGRSRVGFLQLRVQRYASRYALQLRNDHAHHEGDRARAVDRDDRFRIDIPRIGDKRAALGQGNGRDILLVPKRLAAEVDRKGAMRIPSQNLLKGNLVGDARLVIPLRRLAKVTFPLPLR